MPGIICLYKGKKWGVGGQKMISTKELRGRGRGAGAYCNNGGCGEVQVRYLQKDWWQTWVNGVV